MRKVSLAIIAVILLLIAGLASYAGYLLYAASQLYASDFSITGLQDTPQGLSFTGELAMANPSGTAVKLEELRYQIILQKTGEEIAYGTVRGGVIPANDAIRLQISQQTSWLPSMDTLLSLTQEQQIYLLFRGEAIVRVLGMPVTGPFSESVDVKDIVDSWLAEKQREITQDPQRFIREQRQRGRKAS